MARGVARKGQGKGKGRAPRATQAALGRVDGKRRAEGLDIPAETKAIDPLPPGFDLPAHPAADFFPMLEGVEADEFNADVRANGVSVPVTLIDIADASGVVGRQVLDGRNRRRAATLAGQSCQAELYIGSDPVRFVMQRNLRRRHLTDGQKAFAAAEAEGFTHGGVRVGEGKAAPSGKLAITREEAAAMTGASVRAVTTAAKVRKQGSPELINAVRQGKIAPSAAVQALGLAPDDQKKVIAAISSGEAKTAKQVIKRGRVKERNARLKAKVIANPLRQYAVIMTDDEWKHETWSAQGQDRAADTHYSTSDAEVLLERRLAAAEHAVYYMWSTVPHQPLAYEVMKARGFIYRSQVAWWKIYPGNKPGLGYWSRIEHELLLIGTRGDVACPAPGDNWRSVQLSFVGEHSEKPEWCYRMIEAYHPGLIGTMIEYNARKRRRGWSAWGNEIGLIEPPHVELQREFELAPLLPDPDYIEVDRGLFTRLFGSAEDRAKIAANRAKAEAAKVTSSPAAALKAIAETPDEEAPENPLLRDLWHLDQGKLLFIDATALQRLIAEGYAIRGRARKRGGEQRPPLISAHGAAELKAWRERVAEEAGESVERRAPVRGEEFFKAEAERRGIPAGPPPPPLAGQGGPDGDGVPAFLRADSRERAEAEAKRASRRGAE